MIETFRKYSGFAFVILILLFIGLVFMVDGVGSGGIGTGPKVMSYEGRGYTTSEVERQGSDYMNVFQNLMQRSQNASYTDVIGYAQVAFAQDPRDFLANRLLVKKLSEELGVTPNEAEIEDYIKSTLFADLNGEFDQTTYVEFIDKRVKRYGLGVNEFNTIVGEIIAVKELKKIVGSGIESNEEISKRSFKLFSQEIDYEQFDYSIADLQATIEVSEEEVKAYWEENKQNYLTDPQVKVNYVVSDAKLTALEVEKAGELKAKAREEGKTDEEVDAISYSFSEEEKSKLVNEAGDKLDRLFVTVQDQDGKGFKEAAEALGLTVESSESFTAITAPAALKASQYNAPGAALAEAFKLPAAAGMDSISNVFNTTEGTFLMFEVLEAVAPEPKAFDEAKEDAKKALVAIRASESLEEEFAKIQEKLEAELVTQTPEAAAKALGMTYAKREAASARKTFAGERTHQDLFREAVETKDGEFSEPIIQNRPEQGLQRVVLVKPIAREYIETEENKSAMESQIARSSEAFERALFSVWFKNQLAQATFQKIDA